MYTVHYTLYIVHRVLNSVFSIYTVYTLYKHSKKCENFPLILFVFENNNYFLKTRHVIHTLENEKTSRKTLDFLGVHSRRTRDKILSLPAARQPWLSSVNMT